MREWKRTEVRERETKIRNVNELKSQPSAKQRVTLVLCSEQYETLASNVLEIPTSSASPTIRDLSRALPRHPTAPFRDTLATPDRSSKLGQRFGHEESVDEEEAREVIKKEK